MFMYRQCSNPIDFTCVLFGSENLAVQLLHKLYKAEKKLKKLNKITGEILCISLEVKGSNY